MAPRPVPSAPSEASDVLSDSLPFRGASRIILEPSWTLVARGDDLELAFDHSVVIEDGRIAEIVEGPVRGNDSRIPMPGELLIPGMISGHTHVALGSPTRGIIESGRSYGGPAVMLESLSDEDLDALTAYNLAEILRGGCTTQLEQSLSLRHAESYVRVAREWGVRGYPSGMLPTFSRMLGVWFAPDDATVAASSASTIAEIQEYLVWARTVQGAEGDRIRPMIAPHGPETATPETLDAVLAAARELGTGIHTHLATLAHDAVRVERMWGKGPVHWVADHGWYDVPFFGAHMGGWDAQRDAAFLAQQQNFTYVHCPSGAGAGSGQGAQPFIEALGAGINVAVGLDSHSNDMLENAKLSVLYGRLRYDLLHEGADVPMKRPTSWDMIRAVTLNPANGLGRADLGRIEVGALADLTSIDVSGIFVGGGSPAPEPLNNLLYASGPMVRNVMTEGEVQVFDGRLVVDDEQRVIRRGGEVVARLWADLKAQGWFTTEER